MKKYGFISVLATAMAFSAYAQNGSTNQPPAQETSTITRLAPLSQTKPLPKLIVPEPTTSGIIPALRKGTLASTAPEPYSDTPTRTGDVFDRPPRGIVVWSLNF